MKDASASDADLALPGPKSWVMNPYLHHQPGRIHNPLNDRSLVAGTALFRSFSRFIETGEPEEALIREGWIVPPDADLSRSHHLKIVSLELTTACNQKCYFCPVSVAPREDATMSDGLLARIIDDLASYKSTLEGVFLQSYNEPTADPRFVERCKLLFEAGFPVAVLSNGSGLVPSKVDQLMEAGRLRFFCINLSTLDPDRYERDRGYDHLSAVLRNLDYVKDKAFADEMRIVVLGPMDETHRNDFERIRERFATSRFEVQMHEATDRAGWLTEGQKVDHRIRNLAGCDQMGSRPIQHLHITPRGDCILCCQDYDENWKIGNLGKQTIREVLEGDEIGKLRRWIYGIDPAPDDFICRTCVFALERSAKESTVG